MTYGIVVCHSFDLLVVVSTCQLCQALRVQLATMREELGPVLFRQLSAKGVDGDDEGSAVCLKLMGEGANSFQNVSC